MLHFQSSSEFKGKALNMNTVIFSFQSSSEFKVDMSKLPNVDQLSDFQSSSEFKNVLIYYS